MWGSSEEKKEEEKVHELTDPNKPGLDTPEGELFEEAQHYFQLGLYTVARDSFEALHNSYPVGAYSEFAELKIADTYYENNDFAEAAKRYEEFLKGHPASDASAYALLRAARSHHLANKGVGRDIASLQKAKELYDQLLSTYPSSMYAEGAAAWREEVRSRLAAQDKLVLEFYRRHEKEKAAEARAKEFARQWGSESDAFQFEDKRVVPEEKRTDAPTGVAVAAAPRLPVRAREGSTSTTADSANRVPPEILGTGSDSRQVGNLVRSIECDPEQGLVFLSFGTALDDTKISEPEVTGSGLSLRMVGIRLVDAIPLVRSCFAKDDLKLSPDGTLTLTGQVKSASRMVLNHPPRVLLTLKRG